jgi:hypothetical protein
MMHQVHLINVKDISVNQELLILQRYMRHQRAFKFREINFF